MTKEALKLALEALGWTDEWRPQGLKEEAITAIKEALVNEALEKMAENARELGLDYEPAQEPVAWRAKNFYENQEGWFYAEWHQDGLTPQVAELLYTTPPQRKPLTAEMTKQMRESCDSYEMRGAFVDGWLSAEAAHGIKGEA